MPSIVRDIPISEMLKCEKKILEMTEQSMFMAGGGEEGGSERVTGLFKVTQLVWDANPVTSDPKVKILSTKTLPCATH